MIGECKISSSRSTAWRNKKDLANQLIIGLQKKPSSVSELQESNLSLVHGNQQSTKKQKIQSSNQRSCTNYVLPYYRVTPKLFIIIALQWKNEALGINN